MRYDVTVLDYDGRVHVKLCRIGVTGFERALFHARHVIDNHGRLYIERVEIRDADGRLEAVIR